MRISDWSSDVCSSDLLEQRGIGRLPRRRSQVLRLDQRAEAVQRRWHGKVQAVEDFRELGRLRGGLLGGRVIGLEIRIDRAGHCAHAVELLGQRHLHVAAEAAPRSEERRGGKERVRTCRYWWG